MSVVYRGHAGYKPAPTRQVRAFGATCPACGVEPEQPCLTGAGQPMAGAGTHRDRRRAAVRADNLARGL